MQDLLKLIADSVENPQLKDIFEYLLHLRSSAKFGDYIFLLFGSFVVYYLFFFRLRLYLEYEACSKKEVGKLKRTAKSSKKPDGEASLIKWIFMYDSHSFNACKLIHPKFSKILFIYNFATASVYIFAAFLMLPSFFNNSVRCIFMDVAFLHLELNVIPASACNFIYILYRKVGKSGDC